MATNGFKSPAPVLPAMGLHSFHNDSPPFAGAGVPGEPEHLSLDGHPPRPHFRTSESRQRSPTEHANPIEIDLSATPQMPAAQTELPEDDIPLSPVRSRRLVSGYLFGNPPSPLTNTEITINRLLTPPPPLISPSLKDDSPPLTEYTSVSSGIASPSRPTQTETNLEHEPLNMPEAAEAEETTRTKPRARSSKSRDREIGFDALSGLNDGEADLDKNAPQAEGNGTEGYLKGMDEYNFPRHRLRKTMKDESKIPLVIVACGSFSPPTYLHLRMFEMAKDEIVESQTYEIMAGYYSPVSSYYKKSGLAPALDRVRMCELAVENTSTWLMVDPWEAGQPEYQRTAIVLDHFDEMLNGESGGVVLSDGKKRKIKIMLLAGGDLIESFGEPGVWSEPDLHVILGRFGCLIVERAGSDVWAFLLSHDLLYHHRRNVIVIKQLIYNDISSTKVRLFVRRGMSIKYLLPNSVIQYIYDQKLYRVPKIDTISS
ncbi:nicotinamide mononucleotide adenylyltransferase, partial [Tremellales sp. Uapishka_1]